METKRIAIIISDKIDFTPRIMRGHHIMIKWSIHQEDTIINIYAPNIGAPKYRKQMLTYLKWEMDSNTIIGDFNTTFSTMYRSSRQNINKETLD